MIYYTWAHGEWPVCCLLYLTTSEPCRRQPNEVFSCLVQASGHTAYLLSPSFPETSPLSRWQILYQWLNACHLPIRQVSGQKSRNTLVYMDLPLLPCSPCYYMFLSHYNRSNPRIIIHGFEKVGIIIYHVTLDTGSFVTFQILLYLCYMFINYLS